jgi:hypothetical protein
MVMRFVESIRASVHRHHIWTPCFAALLLSACATTALWDATDPHEYIAIPQTEISETELQESGVAYRKDDERGLYYVEKSALRQFGDYTIRALAAPATVVLDAATAIVVIGVLAAPESVLEGLDRKSSGTRDRPRKRD